MTTREMAIATTQYKVLQEIVMYQRSNLHTPDGKAGFACPAGTHAGRMSQERA
jgi:hypothetical protein